MITSDAPPFLKLSKRDLRSGIRLLRVLWASAFLGILAAQGVRLHSLRLETQELRRQMEDLRKFSTLHASDFAEFCTESVTAYNEMGEELNKHTRLFQKIAEAQLKPTPQKPVEAPPSIALQAEPPSRS